MADADRGGIRFELKNSKPVDLLDLTTALSAFGDAYQDYVVRSGFDGDRGNVRLYVQEIRTGSIIAQLSQLADQASFVLDHIEVAAGFISNLNDVLQYFLGLPKPASAEAPTKRQAQQAMAIMEPVAKDNASQLFLNVNVQGDVHYHQHIYTSQQANAIQNSARRYLGPQLPTSQTLRDQLLTLFQVRIAKEKVGYRGVIQTVSSRPVMLTWASDEVKQQIIDYPENPLHKVFLVDVDMTAVDGKPSLYRVLDVKDVSDR